ncbi:MAG TPA: pseudouridine synthase [Terriglobales bacterium]|jgi:23S rRNA pseudouridine2605 synthase
MKVRSNGDRRIGLARAISKLGYGSRSHASELIRAGRVQLNGNTCRNPEAPTHIDTDRIKKDRIAIDGNQLEELKKIYLMLNKPRGIVTTAADEKGRDTIYSLLPPNFRWVAPVGRLDKASEGLLLLTNNSEWGANVLDPANHLKKTYHVQIAAVADHQLLQSLEKGVRDETGELLRATHAAILRGGKKNTWLEIVLEEGKNRQIRRMLAGLNIEVLRLVRISVGRVVLGNLAKGKSRELTREEEKSLNREDNPRIKIS